METAALRDRLEEERARRAKNILGSFGGVYGLPHFEAKREKETTEEVEEGSAEEASLGISGLKETESEPEMGEKAEMATPPVFPAEEGGEGFEEEETIIQEVETGEDEEEGIETEAKEKLEIETETGIEDRSEVEAETVQRPVFEEALSKESGGEPLQAEAGLEREAGEGAEEKKDEEELGVSIGETLEPFERPKRSSLLPVLVAILIVLCIGGGGWYLYRTGVLTSPHSITGKFIEKINAIRGKSALMFFNLKNEQEPALDGRFFTVRGVVQNKQKISVSYVPLRIKIFDAKGKIIMTGRTVAGRILKAEEISKMTVGSVLKTYQSLVDQNRKSSGQIKPGGKLPFLFLFDLSKFPRKAAKTFQVEILKAS